MAQAEPAQAEQHGSHTAEETAYINECIREYNADRPDDTIKLVGPKSPAAYIHRVIRYLGIEF